MISTIANVIIPAFSVPYTAALLFPVAGISVLIAETAVFKLTHQTVAWWKSAFLVLGMNAVSTVIGFIISAFLPDGLEPRLMGSGEHAVWISQPGDNWTTLMYIAFPVAYVLSILIEYAVVRMMKRIPIDRPFRTVAFANTLSYILLITVSYIWAEYIW